MRTGFIFQHVANTMQIADCCAKMLQIPCKLWILNYGKHNAHGIVQMLAPRCCEFSANMRSKVQIFQNVTNTVNITHFSSKMLQIARTGAPDWKNKHKQKKPFKLITHKHLHPRKFLVFDRCFPISRFSSIVCLCSQERCLALTICTGIEYRPGHCELWTRPAGADRNILCPPLRDFLIQSRLGDNVYHTDLNVGLRQVSWENMSYLNILGYFIPAGAIRYFQI